MDAIYISIHKSVGKMKFNNVICNMVIIIYLYIHLFFDWLFNRCVFHFKDNISNM